MSSFRSPSSLFDLRRAGVEDVEAITEVFIRSVEEVGCSYYSAELTEDWIHEFSHDDTFRLVTSPDYCVVVAILVGKIVGVATLLISGRKIEHCYVRGEGSRKGIGSAMLSMLEAEAVTLGIQTVELECSDGTQIIYELNGYAPAGSARMFREKFVVYPYSKKLT